MARKSDVIFSNSDFFRLQSIGEQVENTRAGEELLTKLDTAISVDDEKLPLNVVKIGRVVEYKSVNDEVIKKVEVVFPVEADINQGKIAITSLLGVALLGNKVGAKVDMLDQSGRKNKIEIVSVSEKA